ncbi:MAG: HAD-IIIC family phosphatase [Syntrophomonas sp.]
MNLADIREELRQFDEQNISFGQSANIYFLRNYTLEMIEPFIKWRLYKEKINPRVQFGDYDVIQQEILDINSCLHSSQPDLIVLSLIVDNLVPDYPSTKIIPAEIIHQLESLFLMLKEHTSTLIAVNTFIPPFYQEYGLAQPENAVRLDYLVEELNQFIRQYVANHSSQFILLDLNRYVRILGEEQSIDYRYWYLSRAPFKSAFLDMYAMDLINIIRALKGRTKKCVILDCDNTLWGGIIGEDGLAKIKLHNYEYPGKAYYDFQKNIITLYERGVLIALCSKNNEEDVWEVLNQHPYSLIKRSHLAAWRVNWEDKVTNIKSIVEELNIGMDSIVFVDDSEVECDMIKQYLPEIQVMLVPKHLYTYPPLLLREGLFDTLSISSEDRLRTEMYQAEIKRKDEINNFESLDEYLASLHLTAFIHPIREEEIARVAQMTQKTNQFNLTTHRYSETDIKKLVQNPNADIFTLTVADKFGDYGLTGVFIGMGSDNIYQIDSLLLSCRILGRKLEYAFVNHCLSNIKENRNIQFVQAEYIPTIKNKQVSNFWDQIGFSVVKESEQKKQYHLYAFKPRMIDFISIKD